MEFDGFLKYLLLDNRKLARRTQLGRYYGLKEGLYSLKREEKLLRLG